MLFSYTLLFFVLAASVAAAPLPKAPPPSVPLVTAPFVVGNWMRGSMEGIVVAKSEPIDETPHIDDHIMFDKKGSNLYITLQRANGVHIVEGAGYEDVEVSTLDPAKHPLLPGIWIEVNVEKPQEGVAKQHPQHPAAQGTSEALHDAKWIKIEIKTEVNTNQQFFAVRELTEDEKVAAADAIAAVYKLPFPHRKPLKSKL